MTKARREHGILWLALIFLTIMLTLGFVGRADAAAMKLNKTSLTLNKGKTYRLKVTGTTKKVTWSSSKKSVAAVNSSGKVTAKKKGTAVITAKIGTKKLKCKVTVKQPVTSIKISKSKLTLTAGTTGTLTATVAPTNANNKNVIWKSSNRSVATVQTTSSGTKIKALRAGTAKITVTAIDGSKKSATCTLTVKKKTTNKTNEKTPAASGNAKKLLALLQQYSLQIQADYAAGNYWTYSNKYTYLTWEDAKKGRTLNCTEFTTIALRELGILKAQKGFKFWDGNLSDTTTEVPDGFHLKAKVKTRLLQYAEILTVNKTVQELLDEGGLLPGDIVSFGNNMQHTQVYAGNGLWYEYGRGINSTGSGYRCMTIGPSDSWDCTGRTIVQIVRLK